MSYRVIIFLVAENSGARQEGNFRANEEICASETDSAMSTSTVSFPMNEDRPLKALFVRIRIKDWDFTHARPALC